MGGKDAAGGASGEEAAWRDLIAHYASQDDTQAGEVPWPERENLTMLPRPGSLPDQGPDTDPSLGTRLGADLGADTDPALRLDLGSDADPEFGPDLDADLDADLRADLGTDVRADPDADRGADPGGGTGQSRVVRPATPVPPPPADDDDHFVPPTPPPLPSLDPVLKGAWTALFGGPGYLLLATMLGWEVPGWAALLAVTAFVGGFATLVVRMGDKPRDSGPDDGAVV